MSRAFESLVVMPSASANSHKESRLTTAKVAQNLMRHAVHLVVAFRYSTTCVNIWSTQPPSRGKPPWFDLVWRSRAARERLRINKQNTLAATLPDRLLCSSQISCGWVWGSTHPNGLEISSVPTQSRIAHEFHQPMALNALQIKSAQMSRESLLQSLVTAAVYSLSIYSHSISCDLL